MNGFDASRRVAGVVPCLFVLPSRAFSLPQTPHKLSQMGDSEDATLKPNGLLGGGMKPLNLAAFAAGAQSSQPLVDATNTPAPATDAPRSSAKPPSSRSAPQPQPIAGPSRPTTPRRTPPPSSPRRMDDSPMISNGLLSFSKIRNLPEEDVAQFESQGTSVARLYRMSSD